MRPVLPMICLILAWFASSPDVHAIEESPEEVDLRVKSIDYEPLRIVPLTGFFGFATLIEFDPLERVESVVAGYADAWEVVNLGSMITVKPRRLDADTNLAVVTDKRIYSFALNLAPAIHPPFTSNTAQPTFLLRFRYPRQQVDAKSTKVTEGELVGRLDHELAAGANDNLDYSYSGEVKLVPRAAWDDGRFTYLSFAAEQDLPAVFVVNPDDSESLVNKRVVGDTVVIEHLARQFVLRLGQSVACIFNERGVVSAVSRATHTTSESVQRTILKKEQP